MELQIGLLFSLAVIAVLYGSVGHGGASGYLAILSLSIFASHGAIWLKPHALCLNLVVASLGLYHYGRDLKLPGDCVYDLSVKSAPPTFPRHDEKNGKRYADPIEVTFEKIRIETGHE